MTLQTGVPIVDWFLALLDAWGYLIVFGFTVFENLFVLGSFTPGETVVIAASAVAANGQLQLIGVAVASLVGTVTGSNISYLLGRRAGLTTVEATADRIAASRLGRILRIEASAFEEVETHFHTHGAKTVLISRFAVGAKNFVPAIAGATKMPVFWFELYTMLGAIIYTTLMCAIGWFLGANLEQALRIASGVTYVGLAVFVSFIALLVFGGRRLRKRKLERERDEWDE